MGAGDGRRAREVLRLGPECLTALRLVLVEDDDAARSARRAHVADRIADLVLCPVGPADPDGLADADDPTAHPAVHRYRPLVTSLGELPVLKGFAARNRDRVGQSAALRSRRMAAGEVVGDPPGGG